MEPFTTVMAAGGLAVAAILVGYGLEGAWRHTQDGAAPHPLLGALRREGISPGEAEDALGRRALLTAAQRCAQCGGDAECAARAGGGDCAIADLLEELRLPRVSLSG